MRRATPVYGRVLYRNRRYSEPVGERGVSLRHNNFISLRISKFWGCPQNSRPVQGTVMPPTFARPGSPVRYREVPGIRPNVSRRRFVGTLRRPARMPGRVEDFPLARTSTPRQAEARTDLPARRRRSLMPGDLGSTIASRFRAGRAADRATSPPSPALLAALSAEGCARPRGRG